MCGGRKGVSREREREGERREGVKGMEGEGEEREGKERGRNHTLGGYSRQNDVMTHSSYICKYSMYIIVRTYVHVHYTMYTL